MKAKIITTVTTYVDIATMTPDHEVEIDCRDALPESVVMAAALGGLKSGVKTLSGMVGNDEGDA